MEGDVRQDERRALALHRRAEALVRASWRARSAASVALGLAFPVGAIVRYRWGSIRIRAVVVDHGGTVDLTLKLMNEVSGRSRWIYAESLLPGGSHSVR